MVDISKRPSKKNKKQPAKSQTTNQVHVWATVVDDQVTGAFLTRSEARASKAGKPVKFVMAD